MDITDIFTVLLMGVFVPPMAFTAAIMRLTEKIIEVRDVIVKALGIEDLYY